MTNLNLPDRTADKWLLQRLEEGRSEASQGSLNAILIGDGGSGKSSALATCRQPVYIASFDPGGTKVPSLKALQAEGKAILDTRFEDEDVQKPRAWKAFSDAFNAMEKNGIFNRIGTFAIDSLTLMAEALLNDILRKQSRANTRPQIQDYQDLQRLITDLVIQCCRFPCDFVLTGHINTERDEVDGKIYTSLMVSGKSSKKLPLIFDEVLIARALPGKDSEPNFVFQTKSDGKYKASTRNFGGSNFDLYEKPDFMYLRQKAGIPCEHLAPIN